MNPAHAVLVASVRAACASVYMYRVSPTSAAREGMVHACVRKTWTRV